MEEPSAALKLRLDFRMPSPECDFRRMVGVAMLGTSPLSSSVSRASACTNPGFSGAHPSAVQNGVGVSSGSHTGAHAWACTECVCQSFKQLSDSRG